MSVEDVAKRVIEGMDKSGLLTDIGWNYDFFLLPLEVELSRGRVTVTFDGELKVEKGRLLCAVLRQFKKVHPNAKELLNWSEPMHYLPARPHLKLGCAFEFPAAAFCAVCGIVNLVNRELDLVNSLNNVTHSLSFSPRNKPLYADPTGQEFTVRKVRAKSVKRRLYTQEEQEYNAAQAELEASEDKHLAECARAMIQGKEGQKGRTVVVRRLWKCDEAEDPPLYTHNTNAVKEDPPLWDVLWNTAEYCAEKSTLEYCADCGIDNDHIVHFDSGVAHKICGDCSLRRWNAKKEEKIRIRGAEEAEKRKRE